MNSKSYYNDDYDPCRKDPCRKEKKKEACPVLIKCSSPGSVTIPAATIAGTAFTTTSLTLDTSNLCNPCSKIEFTSNLVAPVAFTGTISFQIFKQCNNQFTPAPIGPAFTFSLVALLTSETFTFFVCDCDSCNNDCCIYTAVATVTSPVTVGTLSINNATLGAISTCSAQSCC